MPPLPHQLHTPRIITYYQTHHHHPSGNHISILPLLQNPSISLTHLILAAIHLNADPAGLTLNDNPPSHPRFTTLWAELRVLQASGIKVLAMLGGAAKGSFTRLDASSAQFEEYYAPLHDLIKLHGLDGLDLDVEEEMSLSGVIRLIDRLKGDFGPEFIITLAPVAAALLNAEHNLSGFDYEALEVMRGDKISWYNTQFYCGWGDCSNPIMYEMVITRGWKAEKVVVGLVTNPENGSGWVPWEALGNVLPVLLGRHPRFGGVMGWEYFNSLPGGKERPWEWARAMTALLKGAGRRAVDELEGAVGGKVQVVEEVGGGKNGDGGSVTRESEADPDDGIDGKAAGREVVVPDGFEYYSDAGTDE